MPFYVNKPSKFGFNEKGTLLRENDDLKIIGSKWNILSYKVRIRS